MITVTGYTINGAAPMEYRGLSTDTKPTPAENGAVFIEMDTGIVYFYDNDASDWINPNEQQ